MLELILSLSVFALICSLCLWIYLLKLELKTTRQTLDIFNSDMDRIIHKNAQEIARLKVENIILRNAKGDES